MTLHIIATGGTFEKHYDEIRGELVFTSSHLPAMMERARISTSYTFEELSMLDSLDMQEEDRMKVLNSCTQTSSDRIVIVHGTDTMQDTAAVLGKAALEKTIVLTGAMIPYEFDHSDAFFNLGFAVSAVQLLPSGVYILMNGQIFRWDKVTKNRRIGAFEALS